MYDPTEGRWLSDDPDGFDAGDTNLYRYVGNDATNATDPSGLYGIFFDGWRYTLSNKTIIGQMYNAYKGHATYYETYEGGLESAVADAVTTVKNVLKDDANEPIDIFGWSRGGIAALILANRLSSQGIKVRFLGLIDPTAPGGWTEAKSIQKEDIGHVGDNVKKVVVLHRDGTVDGKTEKKYFGVKVPSVPEGTILEDIPNDPKRPYSHVQTGFARYFAIKLWNAALGAEVPLPPVTESPFWDKKYSSRPNGYLVESSIEGLAEHGLIAPGADVAMKIRRALSKETK